MSIKASTGAAFFEELRQGASDAFLDMAEYARDEYGLGWLH